MSSTETLTSLAILKVNIDQGNDYLDYLRPFIVQVLVDRRVDPVTDRGVKELIREQFGLEIPERTVQILLRRISKNGYLKKDAGVFHVADELPDPGIIVEKIEAKRHIDAVTTGLMDFSSESPKPLTNLAGAEDAIIKFLSEFDVSCLRAYLRGTAIPNSTHQSRTDVTLVSNYVIHLQKNNPERFESFMVLVKGHMLANALLCPDLENITNNYRKLDFYLDTPLLIQRLGLEGISKQEASTELLSLVRRLGGRVCTFSHSRDELESVISGAAEHLESPGGRGSIVLQARSVGVTKSDLILLSSQIDEQLDQANIIVERTPRYIEHFQIDEEVLEDVIEDEVSYYNPRALQYDINSVRGIYVLRKGKSPRSLEKSGAVLVTSNSGFARAAFNYGRDYEESREVSSVITDFSLANMAWLKAPIGAPDLPIMEVLAFSYAAMRPSQSLFDSYL